SKVDAARATQLLVNRLLHAPLTNLRDVNGAPAADAATRQALRRLFDLGDDEGGER
ncbi:MAG: glutamyl-tRNA reductase, partial [Pseudomonadota bacterium]|nr:glutamyl-tRNA reductase [Pseudomonadota bacterium]